MSARDSICLVAAAFALAMLLAGGVRAVIRATLPDGTVGLSLLVRR